MASDQGQDFLSATRAGGPTAPGTTEPALGGGRGRLLGAAAAASDAGPLPIGCCRTTAVVRLLCRLASLVGLKEVACVGAAGQGRDRRANIGVGGLTEADGRAETRTVALSLPKLAH